MICNAVLTPIVVLIRTVIQIIRDVVRTVCDWVSTVVTTIKTVVEEVCKWLPWPLDKLCDLVTKVIEVVETVWNWVCHEVIERIVDLVEIIVEYVIYVLKWVCWVIDWVVRFPDLVLCWLGIEPRRFLSVCVKILADGAGTPAIPLTTVLGMLRDAATIFDRCKISLVVCSIEVMPKPEFLTSTTCEFSGMFKRFFTWFSAHTCGCCSSITVYMVKDIKDARGCAYPGTDWVTVDASGDGTVIVQEIGHLADLWAHSSDPDNVMTDQSGGTHDQITSGQCCMIRTARFTRGAPGCDARRMKPRALAEILKKWEGPAFERKARGLKVPHRAKS
jgi:hypothetical protein